MICVECALRAATSCTWDPGSFKCVFRLIKASHRPDRGLAWVGFAAICWSLWTTRNKFTIEHIFLANPVNCLFKANVFLQQWRSLTKEGDLEASDDMLSKMRSTTSSLLRRSSKMA